MTNDTLKHTESNLRIDKWLWAVRIFKTRTIAAEACKKKQVSIDGVFVKPSRLVKTGETVTVKKPPISRQYEVLGLLGKRLSAKDVVPFVKDITPEEEIEQLKKIKMGSTGFRPKGLGRPTKKDRRDIENFNPF